MEAREIQLHPGFHDGQAVIKLVFNYDKSRIEQVKKLGARWSARMKCWHVPDTADYRTRFRLSDHIIHDDAFLLIGKANKTALDRFVQHLQLSGYSPSTIRTYKDQFTQVLVYMG